MRGAVTGGLGAVGQSFFDQAARVNVRACQVVRQKIAPQAMQLRLQFCGHAGHREHVLAAHQADGDAAATRHGIGHRHHAVRHQLCSIQQVGQQGQRVPGRRCTRQAKRD